MGGLMGLVVSFAILAVFVGAMSWLTRKLYDPNKPGPGRGGPR